MTLTKNKMIREIGQRTRLKNRDVQMMLETLIEVWTEELASGGRIELEKFLVLQSKKVRRQTNQFPKLDLVTPNTTILRLIVKPSRQLKKRMRNN